MDCRRGAADRAGVRAQLGSDIRQRTPGKLTKLGAMATRTPQEWITDYPLLERLVALEETLWLKPDLPRAEEGLAHVGITPDQVQDAADRLKRFSPYLQQVFPETTPSAGVIESPLRHVPAMKEAIEDLTGQQIEGQLWAKLDSHLPISGSIKARGGIYEVLQHAEALALEHGLITVDSDYRLLDSAEARELFGQHRVAVGSTGNLGLSIGIMSAKLGFQAAVHMSADARQWKKDLLRSHGVEVVEYEQDYSVAVAAGRKAAEDDDSVYFVDDENSVSLFLGYAVAGARLAGQLQALDVRVTEQEPLHVYLPCGVGGGPGGVAFGIKAIFGDAARCYFAEPTHSPAMFIGVHTGAHDQLAVQDFGIDNLTAADGLAVGRPSGFVGERMQHLIDGYYTVSDENMFRGVALFDRSEDVQCEPSSATSFFGPGAIGRAGTHLAWITGGAMVPEEEMASYIARGEELL